MTDRTKRDDEVAPEASPPDAPSAPDPSLAALINDYLAPEQPDDCREASRARLAEALAAAPGPVAHRGKTVALEGDEVVVEDAPPEAPPPDA